MIPYWKDLSQSYDQKGDLKKVFGSRFPKQCRLGPQNNSRGLRPKKMLKIVNCATIKEIEKLKEQWWGSM